MFDFGTVKWNNFAKFYKPDHTTPGYIYIEYVSNVYILINTFFDSIIYVISNVI